MQQKEEEAQMNIKAIIYTSNTGYTRKYAQMLALKTGLEAFELGKVPGKISKGSSVIYMGWLKAGRLMGIDKAAKEYSLAAVCAVGMGAQNSSQAAGVQRTYRLQVPVFYLQGGFDMDKLHGMDRFMMRCMVKLQLPRLEKKKNRTAEEEDMLMFMKKGGDKVSEKNLGSILNWYEKEKQQG